MELKATVSKKGAIFDGKAPEVIREALLSAMYEATMFLERKVKEKTPVRTGYLRSTVYGEVQPFGAPIQGVVSHQCKYGDLVEFGTGVYGPKEAPFTIMPKDKKALWWPGARHPVVKVLQKGFPGRFMFKLTFEKNWDQLQAIFDRMGFNIVRELQK